MIDLHSHSAASDGEFPPAELLRRAASLRIRTLALTDHDTVAGLDEAEAAGRALGIEVIPGIEFSAFVEGHETHLLGHFVDRHDPALEGFGEHLRQERERRMHRMLERLEALGMPCAFEDVVRASGGKNLGRPHLGLVMIQKGYVRTVREAFDLWLGKGCPAHVERYKLTSQEAIDLVRGAGGTTTVAHAHASGLSDDELRLLKRQGICGLEVTHPDHGEASREHLRRLAAELDLVPTAGSDYHGTKVAPGRALGTADMPREDLERLRARAGR